MIYLGVKVLGKVFSNYYLKYFLLCTLSTDLKTRLSYLLVLSLRLCSVLKILPLCCSDWVISTDLSSNAQTFLCYFRSAIASFQSAFIFFFIVQKQTYMYSNEGKQSSVKWKIRLGRSWFGDRLQWEDLLCCLQRLPLFTWHSSSFLNGSSCWACFSDPLW